MMIMRPPQQGHGCRRLRLRLLRAARLFAFLRSFLWSFPKLLAWLCPRTKLARVHVFDHTLTQRGDSLGCHRQLLSWMRLLTPRSSRQGASPATNDLLPGDNAQDEPHLATIAKRFSALARGGGSRQRSTTPAMEGKPDCRRTWPARPEPDPERLHQE